MPSDVLIRAEDVSKKFCRSLKRSLWYGVKDLCREFTCKAGNDEVSLRNGEFLALENVSFQLRRGESLGLIGRNGAGKSTLLKIINGLLKPDAGRVEIRGRVGALIELGTGFSPLLTGRENIYVNAAVLGFSKRQTDKSLDAIIDFAELDEFIDMPLKSYSSGMRVRLGFSVAAQMEPDVLLLDEVLAVGDMMFRAKCYRRLAELRRSGTAFILVSHDSLSILSQCSRALCLCNGHVHTDGSAQDVLSEYERHSAEQSRQRFGVVANEHGQESRPITDGRVRMGKLWFSDSGHRLVTDLSSGTRVTLNVTCMTKLPLSKVSLTVIVKSAAAHGQRILVLESSHDDHLFDMPPGDSTLRMTWPQCALNPGTYLFKVYLTQTPHFDLLDALPVRVVKVLGDQAIVGSQFYQPREWHHELRSETLQDTRME